MVVYRLLSKTLDVCSKLEGFPTIVEESKNMGLMIYIHSTCNRVDKKKTNYSCCASKFSGKYQILPLTIILHSILMSMVFLILIKTSDHFLLL